MKNSTLEIGFPSCAIEKDNFTDSREANSNGKQRVFSSRSSETKAHLRCRCVVVAVLVAKGPLRHYDDIFSLECRYYYDNLLK